jgi:hypothetical protein
MIATLSDGQKRDIITPAILNVKLTREKRSKMGQHEPVISTQTGSELAREGEKPYVANPLE